MHFLSLQIYEYGKITNIKIKQFQKITLYINIENKIYRINLIEKNYNNNFTY